jgi:hypothetical protein
MSFRTGLIAETNRYKLFDGTLKNILNGQVLSYKNALKIVRNYDLFLVARPNYPC